jgi:hypothetical protein
MPKRKESRKRGGDRSAIDPRLREAARLMGEVADEQCGPSASFWERSLVFKRIAEAMLSEPAEDGHDDEREDPEGRPH